MVIEVGCWSKRLLKDSGYGFCEIFQGMVCSGFCGELAVLVDILSRETQNAVPWNTGYGGLWTG